MPISICGKVLLVGTCLIASTLAWGQQAQGQGTQEVGSLDVALVYNPLLANVVGGHRFWMEGGSVQLHGQFWPGLHGQIWRGLGLVADISGVHSSHISSSGVALDLVTASFGPRYTWTPANRRYTLFGQVLAGEAHGLNSFFPAPAGAALTANSLALYVGGGANVYLRGQLSVRAFEADWLRTSMPNAATGVQNNLRLGVGLIFRFK